MTHVVQSSRLGRTGRLARLWHHAPAAVLSAVLALGLVELVPAGAAGPTTAVGLVQAALVLAWPAALRYRGYTGAVLIGGAAAVAADVVARRAALDADLGSPTEGLGPVAAVLALAVILAFAQQLLRRPPRLEVTVSLAGVVLLSAFAVAPAAYLVLAGVPDGTELLRVTLSCIGAAVVVGHLVDLVAPYPRLVEGVPRGGLGFLAGTAAAVGTAVLLAADGGSLVARLEASILGGILGAVAALMAIAASYAVVERRGWGAAQTVLQAAFPFAAAAPVAYIAAVLVRG